MEDLKIILQNIEISRSENGLIEGFDVDSGREVFVRPVPKVYAPSDSRIMRKNFELYTDAVVEKQDGENSRHEALFVTGNYSPNFKQALFSWLQKMDSSILDALEAIERFIRNNSAVKEEDVLGAFAEITVLNKVDGMKPKPGGSIFDMEMNGKNIEIKSVSQKSRDIWLSKEQLLNDTEATLYVVEVEESNAGKSLSELFSLVEKAHHERYEWIRHDTSDLVSKKKYVSLKHGIFKVADLGDYKISAKTRIEAIQLVSAKFQFKVLPSVTSNPWK